MDEKIVKDSQGLAKELVNDCISRKAAIEALGERPMVWIGSDYELGAKNQYDADVLALKTVPSAQPYTDEDIQKLQNIEQAQFDKIRELAYQDGKADAMAEIIHCRNCRYWEREEPFTSIGRCGIWAYTHRKGSDYCSEAREVNE